MAYNTYDVGTQVRLSVAFTDVDGNPADPTTVVCRVRNCGGSISTPTVLQDGTGLYHVDVLLSSTGNWFYRFEGSGALIAVADAQINVTPSPFF